MVGLWGLLDDRFLVDLLTSATSGLSISCQVGVTDTSGHNRRVSLLLKKAWQVSERCQRPLDKTGVGSNEMRRTRKITVFFDLAE